MKTTSSILTLSMAMMCSTALAEELSVVGSWSGDR